jgi:site-specific DNA-methyltransferase (adenine-specific)
LVLDPFCGAGTTGVAALNLGRRFIGIDTDEYAIKQSAQRMHNIK